MATIAVFMVTAFLVVTVAHLRRHGMTSREVATRVRLERAQQLTAACDAAHQDGSVVAVVLPDIDGFTSLDDRTATWAATNPCGRWRHRPRRACAARTSWRARAATNSPSSYPVPTRAGPGRSPTGLPPAPWARAGRRR